MVPTITVRLAQSRSEFESGYRLLFQSRQHWGFRSPGSGEQQLWLLKQHAMPSTSMVIALQASQVVGALCIFGDNPFHLPVEAHADLKSFRRKIGGPLAELSLPGLHPELAHAQDVLLALYQFASFYCASFCDYRAFVTELPAAWVKKYAHALKYEAMLESLGGLQLLLLNSRIGRDFRADMSGKLSAVFQFPDKKLLLKANPVMPPDVMAYLFSECTHLFANLNDFDLRTLKSIYNFGEYAPLMEKLNVATPDPNHPKHPRFSLSCDGYFTNSQGEREHLQVLDVSREGLKIFASSPLPEGSSHALTLYVGVRTQTELIASTVWNDEDAEVAGLQIRSSDRKWAELIECLEKENFLSA